jgi:serine/threonine protein kinase
MLPLTPNKLGRYEIVDELGKGAMGVVYLARDPLIGRLVALKTFRIGYSVKDQEMEQFRVRFMREAQSAGILTHPNIVTIHDVVEDTGDGLAFIAMEYVRGTNLKLLLQGDQPLSLQFVLDVVAQMADALDYAHSNRVIHRDIKPANILITSENRVKITDFGIARLDSSNLTQEGQLLGTPNYMAPEQIQGREVDWRADLFSLGIVLYEMFTRHKPFQGENLTVVSHRIVYDQFTPPQEYVGELPPGVDRILSRALEKEPARRYQRAREMVDELRRVVETSVSREDLNQTQSLSASPRVPPPPAPPAAPASRRSRWWNRPAAAPPPPPSPPASPDPAAEGSSASVPPPPPTAEAGDLNDTVATEAPPPPAPPRPVPVGRWLAMGGILVAVLIIAGAAVKLSRGWSQPAPAPQTAAAGDDPRQIQIKLLLNQGYAAMRRGDFEGGVARFRQAEQVDPSREDIRRLRERAEDQAKDYSSLVNQERAISGNLASARQALAAQKYEQASALASLVLGLEPENADAEAILTKAQQGRARQAKRLASRPVPPGAGEEPATTAPGTPEARPGHPGEPGAADAKQSSLQVHFQSDLDAVLIVRVDNREILRQDLSRGGIFSRLRRGDQGRELTRTYPVPSGTWKVVVYVTPRNKGALIRKLEGNFTGGETRRLEISLSKSAELTAQLI